MRAGAGVILAAAGLLGASHAHAQLGYLWTYEELLQKADVAVIADCMDTVDTGWVRPHPELTPASVVHELRTSFRVSAVLKGRRSDAAGGKLRLRHFRYTADALRGGLVNGGTWLSLRRGGSYLLFLADGGDGVYEPLSGHTFPDDSVFLLARASRRGR